MSEFIQIKGKIVAIDRRQTERQTDNGQRQTDFNFQKSFNFVDVVNLKIHVISVKNVIIMSV